MRRRRKELGGKHVDTTGPDPRVTPWSPKMRSTWPGASHMSAFSANGDLAPAVDAAASPDATFLAIVTDTRLTIWWTGIVSLNFWVCVRSFTISRAPQSAWPLSSVCRNRSRQTDPMHASSGPMTQTPKNTSENPSDWLSWLRFFCVFSLG